MIKAEINFLPKYHRFQQQQQQNIIKYIDLFNQIKTNYEEVL